MGDRFDKWIVYIMISRGRGFDWWIVFIRISRVSGLIDGLYLSGYREVQLWLMDYIYIRISKVSGLIVGLYISGYQGVHVWLMDCIYQDIKGYRFDWCIVYIRISKGTGLKGGVDTLVDLLMLILLQQQLLVNIFINYLITWGGGSVSSRVFNWTGLFENDWVSCLMWIYGK